MLKYIKGIRNMNKDQETRKSGYLAKKNTRTSREKNYNYLN